MKYQHLVTIDDFVTGQYDLMDLLKLARKIKWEEIPRPLEQLQGKILFNLFYEPSTRTSSSFYAAMCKLGGSVIPVNSVQYSSVTKGEDLEDTIITAGSYADVIVLRHYETGAAKFAESISTVPVINAGDGSGEHPTQTLLDAYTIWEYFTRFDDLTITLMGDLKNGRTVHSLVRLMDIFTVEFNFVAPGEYQMPDHILADLENPFYLTEDLSDVAEETNVLYLTRVQKERGSNFEYAITKDNVELFQEDMMVLHPLPRNQELPKWFDTDSRARYFDQMKNGLYVRQAILLKMLGAY